ncbi:hypothetical protein D3C78_1208320 [compost metagenome]
MQRIQTITPCLWFDHFWSARPAGHQLQKRTNDLAVTSFSKAVQVGFGVHRVGAKANGLEPWIGNELGLRHHPDTDPANDRFTQRFTAADLHHHSWRYFVFMQGLLQGQAGRGAAFPVQQRLSLQGLQRNLIEARQGMVDIGKQHHRVACIQLRTEGRIVMQAGEYSDIGHVVF